MNEEDYGDIDYADVADSENIMSVLCKHLFYH